MKIKKINNDKLKIILSSNDLDEKNIDVDSFLANPIESQNLFFEILDLAEEKFDFDIENNKAIVETISLDDNNIFILTITKLKNDNYTYNNFSKAFYFEKINDLLNFYSIIEKNNIKIIKSNIYQLNNIYYFLLNEKNENLENYLLEFAHPLKNFSLLQDIFLEYGQKVHQN